MAGPWIQTFFYHLFPPGPGCWAKAVTQQIMISSPNNPRHCACLNHPQPIIPGVPVIPSSSIIFHHLPSSSIIFHPRHCGYPGELMVFLHLPGAKESAHVAVLLSRGRWTLEPRTTLSGAGELYHHRLAARRCHGRPQIAGLVVSERCPVDSGFVVFRDGKSRNIESCQMF